MLKKNITKASSKRAPTTRSWYAKWAALITLAITPLLIINILILHEKHLYVSDDVLQQLIVQDLQTQPNDALVGQDSFILKMPFYWLLDIFAPHTPETILFTSISILLLTLFTLGLFSLIITRSRTLTAFLIAWIASFGGYVLISFRNPNLRNIELALGLLMGYLLLTLIQRASQQKYKLALIGLALLAALQTHNDPYVFYLFFVPAALATMLLLRTRQAIIWSSIYIVTTFIFWKIVVLLSSLMGIHTFGEGVNLPGSLSHLLGDTLIALQGVSSILSNFQVDETFSVASSFITIAILVFAIFVSFRTLRNRPSPLSKWSIWFGITIIILTIGLYVMSGFIEGQSHHRYLVAIIFGLFCMFAGSSTYLLKNLTVTILVFGLLVSFNLASNITWYSNATSVDNTAEAKVIAKFAKENRVTLGFSDYWNGNINTYFGRGAFKLLPIACYSNDVHMYKFATNIPNFPASFDNLRFFVYFDDQPSSCSPEKIKKSFGERVTKIENIGNKTLLLVEP